MIQKLKSLQGNILLINILLLAWLIPGNAAMIPIFIIGTTFIFEVFYTIHLEKKYSKNYINPLNYVHLKLNQRYLDMYETERMDIQSTFWKDSVTNQDISEEELWGFI